MHSDHQNRSSQDSIMPATLRGLVGKISSLAESICCFLIGLFIAAIVLITLVSVWYRYVLDNPLSWTEQICGILFVWITFLGSAVLYRRVLHIAIDMLLVLMPASARVFFYWINEGLIQYEPDFRRFGNYTFLVLCSRSHQRFADGCFWNRENP